MSDDDLIRRGDALNACRASEHRYEAHDAIESLPAVTPAPDAAAIREAGLREAINVCKVMQTKAKTNAAWLHACEIEEAIAALLTEKPHDRAALRAGGDG